MRDLQDQENALSEQRTLIERKIAGTRAAYWKVSMDDIPLSGIAAVLDKTMRGSELLPQPSKPKAAR